MVPEVESEYFSRCGKTQNELICNSSKITRIAEQAMNQNYRRVGGRGCRGDAWISEFNRV